jgi:tetraacyldisaccharide 4'-kinase
MPGRLTLAIERAWSRPPRGLLLLLPLEWLFAGFTALRRLAFRRGWLRSHHPGVPLWVVGNLTVGGTGKTPVVIALVSALLERGFKPAVISRGYGGSARGVLRVDPDSDSRVVGDEALLIAKSTPVPVVIGKDRLAAARLAAKSRPDVIISDDGLQHYRLGRDLEIVTMDAQTGFGNGHLLPVGPLRERAQRLATVDFLLQRDGQDPHSGTAFVPQCFRCPASGETRPPDDPGFGPRVHAVAAIAQPQRFFATLRALGLDPIEHRFPDHRPFELDDFATLGDLPIVMTSKDAVKCPDAVLQRAWVLDMRLDFPEGFVDQLVARAGLVPGAGR